MTIRSANISRVWQKGIFFYREEYTKPERRRCEKAGIRGSRSENVPPTPTPG